MKIKEVKEMNREELILLCQPEVKKIVRRYNRIHQNYEDFVSIGTIASIEAIDKILSLNVTDEQEILKFVKRAVKFTILKQIRDNRAHYIPSVVDGIIESYSGSMVDLNILIDEILNSDKYSDENKKFLELSIEFEPEEVCKILNIKKRQYYNKLKDLKNKIAQNGLFWYNIDEEV